MRRSSIRRAIGLAVGALAVTVPATSVSAGQTHVRFQERDGETIVTVHDVGNAALSVQYVHGDVRRHAQDGSQLYYRIDLTELPPGFTAEETETAIESAVATFNDVSCSDLELVRVGADEPPTDLGLTEHLLGFGGSADPATDITFAGWVPPEFFAALGDPGANGQMVPVVFDADETSLVVGYEALTAPEQFSDVDHDRNADLFATELYFNAAATFTTDADAGNSLFVIDLESVALHELGHALGIGHFGRTQIVLDENGDFVDVSVNPNSSPMMNTNNYLTNREVSGSDRAWFCNIYANWGTPGRGQ